MYDCIIIGAGPAGMAAAIYLARKKMKIIVLTGDFGGQTAKASSVENYPGFEKISGPELSEKMHQQIEKLGVESKSEEVKGVEKDETSFNVTTYNGSYKAKSVIVCSGKTHRKLGVPGEEEFTGKGVSYCAICDGPLFKDKTVVIVGGGNSALDAALELEKYAKAVFILNISDQPQCDAILLDRFKDSPKSQIICGAKTKEIYGDGFVRGLKYEEESGNLKDLPCEGIFVEIGWTPSTDFVKNLVKVSELSEIEVDKTGATACEGIYAAGDVTDTPFKQIVIAAGEGAKAALSAWKYLITK